MSVSLERALDELLAVLAPLEDDLPGLQGAQLAGRAVSAELDHAAPAAIDAAAARLAPAIRPDRRGAQAALSLGVLIEHGADPAHIRPVLALLVERLPLAGRFVAAVTARPPLSEEAAAADPNPFTVAGRPYALATLRDAADAEPEGGQLWLDLAPWCLPCIAALTRDTALRRAAQDDAALHVALEGLEHEEGTSFLTMLVRDALADEVLHVLHPGEQRGFRVRAVDVVSGFQLHALLAAALVPLGLPGEAPSPAATACFRGEGPPALPTPTAGAFNLWQWTGLGADGTLPEGTDERAHWIWNEGAPREIRTFEGVRTVLLGPPPYERSWNTGRTFGALRSDVRVEAELARDEVRALLDRIRTAAAASG